MAHTSDFPASDPDNRRRETRDSSSRRLRDHHGAPARITLLPAAV
jgi:hypothetical protein